MVKKESKIIKVVLSAALSVTLIMSSTVSAFALSYSGSSSYMSNKYYTQLTKVNLTGNKRTDIVNIAKSQVGYKEGNDSTQLAGTVSGSKNYTEYGR